MITHDLMVLKLGNKKDIELIRKQLADKKTINLVNDCLSGGEQRLKLGITYSSWQSIST